MAFNKKTIRDIDVVGKTVLVRADYNVPMNDHGVISDDYRIRMSLPTIEHLRGMGAKIVLISHLGRPKTATDASCSLAPVATRLSDLLHLPVQFVPECTGEQASDAVATMQVGDIVLLENLRYHPQEEANDEAFAKKLAALADVFVQDGFGVVHRAHASTDAITRFVPSVAGVLLEREATIITRAMEAPDRPLAVIIGGAKISDKLPLLETFIEKADFVAVVGAMANTLLLADGHNVGKSLVEKNSLSDAKKVLHTARQRMKQERFTFYIPEDAVVATKLDGTAPTRVVDIASHTYADITSYPKKPNSASYSIAEDELILDIGPMSASVIAGAVKLAKTAIWNGTAGVTETKGLAGSADPFGHGTSIIARSLSGEQAGDKNVPFSVVGGGDTVGYVESVSGLRERLNHVSTGGGASLELMAGQALPGIEALQEKDS